MMNQFGMNFGPNMSMPNGMQGGNMFMGMNNMMPNSQVEDQEWLKGFTLGVQEVAGSQEEDDGSPKINGIFTTTKGKKTTVILSVNITIDQALQKYLNKVGNDDLYTQKSNRICFLYNGVSLKFGDQTKVGDFFGINKTPNIIVNDVYNLIGAKDI